MKRSYQLVLISVCLILSLTLLIDTFKEEKSTENNISQVVSIGTWMWSDMFDPETALGHGIPGYVEIKYDSEIPPITIVSPGNQIDYPITYSLIPYTDNLTETIIVLDPSEGGSGGVQEFKFTDYVSYKPNVFLLKVGEPVKVMMTYSIPEDYEHGFSARSTSIIGQGTHSYLPVKSGGGGWSRRVDLEWAYTLLENKMSVTPVWFMVNRFASSSHPETIVLVESLDFDMYPKLKEGFEVEERYAATAAHPYEWVECSSQEGIEIVEYLGGDLWPPYGDSPMWYKEIRFEGQYFSLVMIFSEKAPPIW